METLYLVGPSSTGKSTLFHAIMKDMKLDPSQCITEVARTVMKKTDFSRKTVGDLEMQRTILKAQMEAEEAARSVAGSCTVRMVLSDRSAIDPVAYAILTGVSEEDSRERMGALVNTPEFQAALSRYREATFILFKPVPEWLVDDGVRSMEKQDNHSEVFRGILKELEIPYVELGGEIKDLEERVAFAKGLLNANEAKR